MMLLSAVLLIFAFLALSAMVSRVAQLGSTTAQEQDRPLLQEIEVVQDIVDETVRGFTDLPTNPATTGTQLLPRHVEALQGSLAHLAALKLARGFDLEWRFVNVATGATVTACDAAATPATLAVAYTLDDGEVAATVRSTATFSWIC